MDKSLALEKQKTLRISLVQIVREEYEMVLLNNIFESSFGNKLVFRGGTALRLAYGSPRFSDDLDFTQIGKIKEKDFQEWCTKIAQATQNLELIEALKKYYTLYAKFRIKDPVLPQTIGIKVEISVRKEKWTKGKDYTLMNLKSEMMPITVMAQVASLEWIKKEKLTIFPPRIRDVFDLWFIGQVLKQPAEMDFSQFKANQVKRELHRLLPEGKQKLIETWLPKE
ncbi:nucleotidyl transferase AbiEii/AbiGii toxin family protein [Patescibacteria group bacterium]|nr:nucleotidyl transferase AbiEii/AbiGii toxin family protein [Patescibacteria group bacterium]MBU1931744.1 nucleotidyl transferase AbiEii/AbiGii toxin family protein [Patescibacteria group bacterium]